RPRRAGIGGGAGPTISLARECPGRAPLPGGDDSCGGVSRAAGGARWGGGAIGAWVILIGFAMGATTANVGALAPLRGWLQRREFELRLADAPPTLPTALGVPPWLVIAVLGARALYLLPGRAPRAPH